MHCVYQQPKYLDYRPKCREQHWLQNISMSLSKFTSFKYDQLHDMYMYNFHVLTGSVYSHVPVNASGGDARYDMSMRQCPSRRTGARWLRHDVTARSLTRSSQSANGRSLMMTSAFFFEQPFIDVSSSSVASFRKCTIGSDGVTSSCANQSN